MLPPDVAGRSQLTMATFADFTKMCERACKRERKSERERDSVESSFKKLATTDNKNLNKNPVNICKK